MFIEEKQWEIIGLEQFKSQLEDYIEETARSYYPFSNPKYLQQERKGNIFLSSTIDYFCFCIPASLVLFFIFNRVFHLLFDYEISKYLRVYSFKLVLVEMLIQGNIEYFTFLGFRSIDTSFSFQLPSRLLVIMGIVMLFITVVVSLSSFFLYYIQYEKLARYFLINLFRFPSSYGLMVIVYGLKPLVKGAIHALAYEQWQLQIWLLIGAELLILIIMFIFEFRNDNHKSKLVFMMDVSSSGYMALLNFIILCKYEYFKEDAIVK